MRKIKHFLFLIPLLALFLIPNQVFAAETSKSCSGCNYILSNLNYYDTSTGGYVLMTDRRTRLGNEFLRVAQVLDGSIRPYYIQQFGSSGYWGVNLEANKKYSLRLVFDGSIDNFPDANIDTYLSDLYLLPYNSSYELIEGEFYDYLNYGIKGKQNGTSGYWRYYFVIEITPTIDIPFIQFEYMVKSGSSNCDNNTDGTDIPALDNSIVPVVTCFRPVAQNKSDFYNVVWSQTYLYEVDEYNFLETEALRPVIPNPDNKPVFDTYNPDDSILDGLESCNQDNILDRFSCIFGNFQTVFNNIFSRIGNAIQTLNQNIINFFTNLTESLKELFVPENDDFLKDFLNDFIELFSTKLGFLTYPFEVFADILDKFFHIETSPIIKIPDIKEPFNDFVIIKAQEFNIQEIFNTGSFKTLYDIYMAFVGCYFIILFLNYCIKKYNEFVKARGDGF